VANDAVQNSRDWLRTKVIGIDEISIRKGQTADVLTRLGPTIDPEDDYQRYVKGANILASLYGAK
jgi:hypothetical protein